MQYFINILNDWFKIRSFSNHEHLYCFIIAVNTGSHVIKLLVLLVGIKGLTEPQR